MKMTTVGCEQEIIDFAKRAAKRFSGDRKLFTYSDRDIAPGELFAMKYGLGDDCVLVFRVSEEHEVVNFQGLMRDYEVPA